MRTSRFGFVRFTFGALALATGCSEAPEPSRSAVLYVAAGTRETTAFAGFLGDGYGANRCKTSLVDRCYITTCLDGGGVQTYVDGGKVDFEAEELDATLDTGKVEDSDGNKGPGLALVEGLPVLKEDETITISVRGNGNVPKVQSSIQLPPRLELAEPELEEPACQGVDPDEVTPIRLDATDDFKLRWSSERDDDVDVLFMFDDIKDFPKDNERERATTIRCLYTADEETVEVPEEVVEQMPHGPGTFTVRHIVSKGAFVDNWAFTFGAYWELCSPIEVE